MTVWLRDWHLPVHPSVYPPVYPPVCLSVCPPLLTALLTVFTYCLYLLCLIPQASVSSLFCPQLLFDDLKISKLQCTLTLRKCKCARLYFACACVCQWMCACVSLCLCVRPSCPSTRACVRACVRVRACTCVTYEKRSGLVILLSTFLGYVCVLLWWEYGKWLMQL